MKRKNRRLQKKRRVYSKKLTRIAQAKKKSRKLHRMRRKKLAAVRRRQPITDPRVARGLGHMRRDGISASAAAKRARMKLRTFRKGAGKFLDRSGPGKPWKARTEDQLRFSMKVLTVGGRVDAIVPDSSERKLLHDYEIVVTKFRGAEDGAEEELKRFDGKTVGGHKLITDPKVLIELEEAGELDFESLYTPFRGKS